MHINIAICDDEADELHILENYIKTFEKESGNNFHISSFNSPYALLKSHKNGFFDVIFLDVEMPDMDGIELASSIRKKKDKDTKIIYVSNYPEYMQASFSVHAYNYLTKPLNYHAIELVMRELIDDLSDKPNTKFTLTTENGIQLFDSKDLFYIEVLQHRKNTLAFHFNNHIIEAKGTLANIKALLAPLGFVTPYKGILLNPIYILVIGKTSITLTNNETLPLSRGYANEVKTVFLDSVVNVKK